MNHWKKKSESDLEQVWAETAGGKETGRYRYSYPDGRVVEVGKHGLDGRKRKARRPHQIRNAVAVSAVGAAVVADVVIHLVK